MTRTIVLALLLASSVACVASSTEHREAGAERLVRDGEIPCAPRAVLAAVCWNCHTDPPKNGAPFSEQTYRDIDSELDGEPVWSRMRRAIEDGRMPLDPYTLTDDQRATLLAWLRAEAPPAPVGTVCSP